MPRDKHNRSSVHSTNAGAPSRAERAFLSQNIILLYEVFNKKRQQLSHLALWWKPADTAGAPKRRTAVASPQRCTPLAARSRARLSQSVDLHAASRRASAGHLKV